MAKKIVTYFGPSAGGKNITGFARGKLIKGAEKSFSNKKNTGSLNVNNTSTGNVTDNLNRAIGLSPGSQGVVPKGPRDPRGASGYIPNFAGSLQDSIARESAAGLPINQIRINQNPRLRNAGNPMGLAVTNTRDEPTGAIPNFAQYRNPSGQFAKRPPLPTGKTLNIGSGTPPQLPNSTIKQIDNLGKSADKAAKSTDKTAKGQRDMLGGIFATQIAFSALAGATSDMDEGFGRFANRITTLGSSLTTAAFAGPPLRWPKAANDNLIK